MKRRRRVPNPENGTPRPRRMQSARAMRLALREARRASGRTYPNPAVGAVVFRGDRVLGRGRTAPPGGAHAEVAAMAAAARRHGDRALRGASLAVTLEPCCHEGRTGPCTRAIMEAGIRRVAVGHRDPHPLVRGGGIAQLRRSGVEVEEGVLESECREQHRGFLSAVTRGRPFLTLKLATTLDARIATAAGESRWITGPEARAYVHRLREHTDAVLVGSGTALADDPALTARRGARVVHRPLRIVVDSHLRIPIDAKLFSDGYPETTWVFCAKSAAASRRRALDERGVRVDAVAPRADGLPLRTVLRAIARAGPGTLLCEGGGGLGAALVRADLTDELLWIAAPTLLGGDAQPALGALGVGLLARAPELDILRTRRLGRDVLMQARFVRSERGGKST